MTWRKMENPRNVKSSHLECLSNDCLSFSVEGNPFQRVGVLLTVKPDLLRKNDLRLNTSHPSNRRDGRQVIYGHCRGKGQDQLFLQKSVRVYRPCISRDHLQVTKSYSTTLKHLKQMYNQNYLLHHNFLRHSGHVTLVNFEILSSKVRA